MILLEAVEGLALLVRNSLGSFNFYWMTVRVVGSRIKTNRTNMQEPDTLSNHIITHTFITCKSNLHKNNIFFIFLVSF